jgi:hypothetical protein
MKVYNLKHTRKSRSNSIKFEKWQINTHYLLYFYGGGGMELTGLHTLQWQKHKSVSKILVAETGVSAFHTAFIK